MTLRSFLTTYDSYVLNTWDHTANVITHIHNQTITILNSFSDKKKLPLKSLTDFHPFRKKRHSNGLLITPKNIGMLKFIATGKGIQKARPTAPSV